MTRFVWWGSIPKSFETVGRASSRVASANVLPLRGHWRLSRGLLLDEPFGASTQ
jgi:hypothetical protein